MSFPNSHGRIVLRHERKSACLVSASIFVALEVELINQNCYRLLGTWRFIFSTSRKCSGPDIQSLQTPKPIPSPTRYLASTSFLSTHQTTLSRMHSKIISAVAMVIGAAFVAGQTTPLLPECVLGCAYTPLGESGCGLNPLDAVCICEKVDALMGMAMPCLQSHCANDPTAIQSKSSAPSQNR